MQKKFVYKKKKVVEDAEGTEEVLTYAPSDMDSKDIEIKIKGIDIAETLGLPVESYGDSVIVEFGAKEKQSKLIVKEKEKKKESEKDD